MEQSKIRADRSLNTTIPREHDAKKHELEMTQVNWRATEKTTRDALEKKRLEVAAAQRTHEKAAEKLEKLKGDLTLLTVKAPHDGIVYYGAASRGKWATAAAVEKKLVPGGKVMPREIFMTVVDPNQLQIRASVPETKLKDLEPGLSGTANPTWNPEDEFNTRLQSISYIPLATNTFDAVLTTPKQGGDQIYPGMTAKIRIEIYMNEKAVAVPKKAVKKEGKGHFVTMKDGKKKKVKVGKSSATMTEILEGLKAGDEIKTQ
ncbi:MAG: HlyD family efflux transporter periplasmic adaptor subunit [Verrucomicrobiales bacterium]|nr:HlyD family efflux transporter periplasmic adaptor subunit [Verrucomicrobiales bacterium]